MRFLLLLALVGLALTFFGSAAPFFDSLAHFRWHGAMVVFGLALIVMARARFAPATFAILAAGAAAASTAPYVVPRLAPTPIATLSVLSMNLNFRADLGEAKLLVDELIPTVITLQEVTDRHWETVSDWGYPYRARCEGGAVGGTAILSRAPFEGSMLPCGPGGRMVGALVDVGDASVWVVSQHMPWPWPSQGREPPRPPSARTSIAREPRPAGITRRPGVVNAPAIRRRQSDTRPERDRHQWHHPQQRPPPPPVPTDPSP